MGYGDGVDSMAQENSPNPNVLAAISKSMQAVKFCSKKIFQFLTGVAA